MTSYGSYNPIKKPIVGDGIIIALANSCVSFVSGFAVWSIVGYLATTTGRDPPNTSLSLVFITYPEAIDTIGTPNFWGILLSLTLFLLGLDSAFALIEACSTVIYDALDNPPSRAWISFWLCLTGFGFSLPFCTNWGFILFDVVDHYLNNYLLFIVGMLQCFGVAWLFDFEKTCALGPKYARSVKISLYGYWFFLFLCGVAGIAEYNAKFGMIAFITVECVFVLPWSFLACDASFNDWYNHVCMCGISRIGWSMSKLGRLETKEPL